MSGRLLRSNWVIREYRLKPIHGDRVRTNFNEEILWRGLDMVLYIMETTEVLMHPL